MSDESVEATPDTVDPVLRYGTAMLLAGVIAGFLGVWLEVGFRTGVAVGVPVGILIGYVLRPVDIDEEQPA